jgi:GntR family transcriptional regulator
MLRADILSGAYQGSPLPSEAQLMRGYNASRGVVRKALGMLRDEKLVRRLQGQGTFAVAPAVLTRLVEAHGVAAPAINSAFGGQMRPDILTWTRMRTPDSVVRLLGYPVEECLCVEYVSYLDGQPVGLATNYVADPEGEQLKVAHFHSDWYQLLKASGVLMASSTFVIGCEAADAKLAELLGIAPQHPLLTMDQTISDATGRIFNVAYIHARGDRFAILSVAGVPGLSEDTEPPSYLNVEAPGRPSPVWARDATPATPRRHRRPGPVPSAGSEPREGPPAGKG